MKSSLPVRCLPGPSALVATACVALAAAGGGGCKPAHPLRVEVDFQHRGEQGGETIATFGPARIEAEELKRRFLEMNPNMRARLQTVEQRREHLEGLLRFELLAAEAVRRGLANDPDVVDTAKKVMVQKLLTRELDAQPEPVTDAQVQAYYEQHRADYVKPELVRLSHVFFRLSGEDEAGRARKRAVAEGVLAKARGLSPMDFQGFAGLVKGHSEEPRTRSLDGDLRFLSLEELAKGYGAPVAEAATELSRAGEVGQVWPRLVETAEGLHVLRFQARQPPLDLKVEQVKASIQAILLNERRQTRYDALLEELKRSQKLKVDTAALGRIEVDMKAPALDSTRAAPGRLPAPQPPPFAGGLEP